MTEDEGILVTDKTDFTILSTLVRNCKSSYSSIGFRGWLNIKEHKGTSQEDDTPRSHRKIHS